MNSGSPGARSACGWSLVAPHQSEICDGIDDDRDQQVDEGFGCTNGDACRPGGGPGACNATNDSECAPVCGNGVVEPTETCDGNCLDCDPEVYSCFASSGSADTCDLACHVPVQECGAGDGCRRFEPDGGGAACGSANDAECKGTSWKYVQWLPIAMQGRTTVRVYGIVAGGSYLMTTCAPPGVTVGSGDSVITSVVDSLGLAYDVANDDCTEPGSIPQLAGRSCLNAAGQPKMSCASPSPGGFQASNDGSTRFDVTVSGFNDGALSTPFFVWYNATGIPNPG